MRRALVVSACVLALLVVTACAEDETSFACSDGPAQYGPTKVLPRGERSGRANATCVGRCGETQVYAPQFGAPSWRYESLPSGACTGDGRCTIATSNTQTCAGVLEVCSLDGVECGCESGQWRCYMISQGSGACLPCDAGPGPGAR